MSFSSLDLSTIYADGPEALDLLHDGTSGVYRSAGLAPAEGSLAAIELSTVIGKELVLTAFSQGAMLVEIAADQAMACRKTLTSPAQTMAPWTSARSAMEAAALGCWLMDIEIDRKTRIQRSYAFRYEGLSQQEKYARSVGDLDVAKATQARILKVEQDAVALGYEKIRDRKQNPVAIGQLMPSITEIVRDNLNKESDYRLFSAVAHAHFWALNNLSLQRARPETLPPPAGGYTAENSAPVEKALTPVSIGYVVLAAMESFSRIVWTRFQLFGWQQDALKAAFDNAFDKIHLKESFRFWRK